MFYNDPVIGPACHARDEIQSSQANTEIVVLHRIKDLLLVQCNEVWVAGV